MWAQFKEFQYAHTMTHVDRPVACTHHSHSLLYATIIKYVEECIIQNAFLFDTAHKAITQTRKKGKAVWFDRNFKILLHRNARSKTQKPKEILYFDIPITYPYRFAALFFSCSKYNIFQFSVLMHAHAAEASLQKLWNFYYIKIQWRRRTNAKCTNIALRCMRLHL